MVQLWTTAFLAGSLEATLRLTTAASLLHDVRDVRNELADRPLRAQCRGDQVRAVDGVDLDRRILIGNLFLAGTSRRARHAKLQAGRRRDVAELKSTMTQTS